MTYQDDDRIGALIKERDAERAIYNNAIARHLAEIKRLTADRDSWKVATEAIVGSRDARIAEIKRLTKERDEIKSEASELAADLKRVMGEDERLRTGIAAVIADIENEWEGKVILRALYDLLGTEQIAPAWSMERCRAVDRSNIPATCDWPRCCGYMTKDEIDKAPGKIKRGEIVECARCGGPVTFGDCCNECDKPSDY